MKSKQLHPWLRFGSVLSFLAVIIANGAANAIPLNGITTGEVSDRYFNLFAPTGLTFAIWGLIYMLLTVFIIHQFRQRKQELEYRYFLEEVNIPFIITNVANTLWIFAWHYQWIDASLLLMIVILLGLIRIAKVVSEAYIPMKDRFWVRWPFMIYFGWITVATIANVTTWLVFRQITLPLFNEEIWTVIILLVGTLIGTLTIVKYRSVAYGGVFLWAYLGIYLKHTSVVEFNNQYPVVVISVSILMIWLLLVEIFTYRKFKEEEI